MMSKIIVSMAIIGLLAGCGGGSSSSGGGSAEPAFLRATFDGSYRTDAYNGTITVTFDQQEGIANITLTGISCLRNQIRVSASLRSNTIAVSGNISGRTNATLGIPAFIRLDFPSSGGSGSIDIDPGTPCLSSIGTLNVTRK